MWEYDKKSSQNLKSQSYFRTGWVDSATVFPSCPSRVNQRHTIHPLLWLGAKLVGCHPQLLIRRFVGHHSLQKREGTLLLFQQLLLLIDQLQGKRGCCLLGGWFFWTLETTMANSSVLWKPSWGRCMFIWRVRPENKVWTQARRSLSYLWESWHLRSVSETLQ